MKLFHVRINKWLGPGTPFEGIVREEDVEKAIQAFVDPNESPFQGAFHPLTRFWHELRSPKPTDFDVKLLGTDDYYEAGSYSTELRDPEKNTGEVLSAEEVECRRFLEDRIVVRVMRDGGFVSKFFYSAKLTLARWLRSAAAWLDESADREPGQRP